MTAFVMGHDGLGIRGGTTRCSGDWLDRARPEDEWPLAAIHQGVTGKENPHGAVILLTWRGFA